MANSYIYQLTDNWSNASQDWVAINMNVTDNGSTANSALINLSANGANQFTVFKSGDAYIAGGIGVHTSYTNILPDGMIVDYTTGNARIMVGQDDGLFVYSGNSTQVTNTTVLMHLTNTGLLNVGNTTANVQLGSNTIMGTPSVVLGLGNSNSSVDIVVTNANTGGNTSSDFAAYDSAGLTSPNFVDMGINGNTWSAAFWTINGPSDGYLYTGNTNLSIGTAGANYLNFFTGGTLAANERMRITATGNVGIGNTAPDATLKVQGTANISGNVVMGGKLTVSNSVTFNTANGTGSVVNSETGLGTLKLAATLSIAANTVAPESIYFKPDGLQMYVGTYSATSNTMWQYTLSSAWNIGTATYTRSALLSGPASGIWIKPDTGTKLYTIEAGGDIIHEYNLGTAWDISTTSYSSNVVVTTQDSGPEGLAFSANGSTLWVLGNVTDTVYQYTLSTPWSVNTATYASKSLVLASGTNWGMHVDSTSTYVYITENSSKIVYQYTMATPGDISTATLTGQQILGINDSSPEQVWVESAQGKAYMVGDNNNSIYQYSMSPGFIVSNPSSTAQIKGSAEITGNVVIGGSTIYSPATLNIVSSSVTTPTLGVGNTVSGAFSVYANSGYSFRAAANGWVSMSSVNGISVDGAGNMGFNGYNPTANWKLDVVDSSNTVTQGMRIWNFADQTNASAQFWVQAGLVAGRQSYFKIASNTLSTTLGTSSNTPLYVVANNTIAMTVYSNNDIAITSNTLALGSGGLVSAQAANGWSMLPNGMKANYGWVAANSSVANVTFTSPFTTACLHVFLTPVSATATGPYLIQPANTTVAPIRTTSATAANVAYYAIGY